ncbi:MAG: TIGR02285 family protein [Methylocystaceae bacterium]|nr:TIGR02285 family protein [Methylocystaceae bacterium]
MKYILFIATLFWLQNVNAQDFLQNLPASTLTWQTFDAPPLTITNGTAKGSGIVDGIRNLLINKMPEYQHQVQELPYKRFLVYAKQGRNICTGYLFKSKEREEYMTFSKPAVIFPGVEALMRKETIEDLKFKDAVSLNDLFGTYNLRLETNSIRFYSDKINPIIKEYEHRGLVQRHTGSTTYVFRLLAAKRADFMIDFPNRIPYWVHELNLDPNDFASVALKEDTRNILSYVACPKTPWGQKVIARVNDILDEEMKKESYLNLLLRWAPVHHIAKITELYNTKLLGKKAAFEATSKTAQ